MTPPRGTVPPRLPARWSDDPLVLADEASWDGVEVTGSFAGRTASHVDVTGCALRGALFTGAEIDRLRLVDSVVEDCELSAVVLPRLAVARVEFHRCRLSGLVAAGGTFRDVRFTDCKLDGVNFRMSSWERCGFEDCLLADADFRSTTLGGARLRRCDLSRADFSAADMTGVTLHGSTLDGVRGGSSFRGVVIGSDQVIPMALSVFAALSIGVDDDVDALDG
jgi:uncharacterized protein YjbI with pentapeptide repeats